MKRKIISIFLTAIFILSNFTMSFAASSSEASYLKSDYLDIVNELNQTYGTNIQLNFHNDGDYVSASDIPSPEQYRSQLVSMIQKQQAVKQAVALTKQNAIANGSPDLSNAPIANSSSYKVVCDNVYLGINYTTTYSNRYYFAQCTGVFTDRTSAVSPYTFMKTDTGSSLIDSNRTISAWADGSLVYSTATYTEVFDNWTLSAEFYIDSQGKVTAKSMN